MQKAGAFDNYATPLGETAANTVQHHYHNPLFPGDNSYGFGVNEIKNNSVKLPQDTVDAQRQSFNDAIDHYIPQEQISRWMHEYFSGDFMHSPSFRGLVKGIDIIQSLPHSSLDSQYTLRLNDKERTRNDRKLFTPEEWDLTLKVFDKLPALPITVMGYQASFIGYLEKLDTTITHSKELSNPQKRKAKETMKYLKDSWSGPGFYTTVLPAVAVHCYRNHNGNMDEKPTQKDFNDGMLFIMKRGAFRNKVAYADNSGDVQFTCPAQKVISKTSAISLDNAPVSQPEVREPSMSNQLGMALFHIFREVDKNIVHNSKALAKTNGDLKRIFDATIPQKKNGWRVFS